MSMKSNPLRWHGGKSYLAAWILQFMPNHSLYREPFFGGGAVLFRKNYNGISEAVNDKNDNLIRFWRVIANAEQFREFVVRINLMPYSTEIWRDAVDDIRSQISDIDFAVSFFIKYRMSRQGLGSDFTTPTQRVRRGMNEHVSAYLAAVDGLVEACDRLRRVEITNLDAIEFIRKYDSPYAVFYCDPPYLHSTRENNSTNIYDYEMSEAEHVTLLESLSRIKGRFLLSGYPSKVYSDWARENGLYVATKEIDNKSSGAATKAIKTECLWMNYS